MNRRQSSTGPRDRGAAAVEFALVLPLLLLLVFGVIDFGRLLHAQVTLTQAAREGGRLAALGVADGDVTNRTVFAATGLSGVTVAVTACATGAGPTADAAVQAGHTFTFVTPVGAIAGLMGSGGFGGPLNLTANGVLPCET